MNQHMVDRIVHALLYEGYILYPYRASAVKNRLRFNFGVIYPRAYAEAQSGNDLWTMKTQCLAAGGASSSLAISVRFLRLIESGRDGWQEAAECRVDLPPCSPGFLAGTPLQHEFSLPPESPSIHGRIEAHAAAVPGGAWRITVRIVNTAELPEGTNREEAMPYSLVSAHTILGIKGGEFVSLLDPPEHLREAASACDNIGAWPVLVGEAGEKNTILSAPVILYDYPTIAPESPGDLFDSTEIDEILTLRVLTMTDEEKDEACRTDPHARRIVERAESLDAEQFSKLHGAFRGSGGRHE